MPSVKRLIANFLVVAAIGSLLAFAFSAQTGFFPWSNIAPAPATATLNAASVPRFAFNDKLEQLPIALRGNLSGARTNLTRSTAQDLADVIVALNPNGAQTVNGETGLVIPTTTVLAGYLTMKNVGAFKVSDLFVSSTDESIAPATSSDVAANLAYAQGFRNVMGDTLASSTFIAALQAGAANNTPNDAVGSIVAMFSDAIAELRVLPTPAPFADFQQKFLAYLEDQRNVTAAVAIAGTDPLKSLIVLGNGIPIVDHVNNDFKQVAGAYDRLDLSQLLSQSRPGHWSTVASGIQGLFSAFTGGFGLGMPTALAATAPGLSDSNECGNSIAGSLGSLATLTSAFSPLAVPVVDKIEETNTASIYAVLLFECKQEVLTQEAKASATNAINAMATANVQRDGNPSFIRDYQTYTANAGVQGATKAYQADLPNICPQFQNDVQNIVFNPISSLSNLVNNGSGQGTVLTSDSVTNLDNSLLAGLLGPGAANLDFGSSNIVGIGTGCQLQSKINLSNFYNNFTSEPNSLDNYLSLITDPTNNLYGTLALTSDDIGASAQQAAAAAQTQAVANQGYRSDVECGPGAVTDSKGNTICPNEKILTPGSVINKQLNTAINAQLQTILNSNNASQIDSELANSLTNQLMNHPDQGLYDLSFSASNSFSTMCNSILSSANVTVTPGLLTTPALTACNSEVGKITGYFTKYLSLIKDINSYLSLFF